ncbi:aminopeptidase P N-terminal domain-containing protein [Maribacter sp. PR1]|uniref:Xaa-Pro aminopeptidase n=1 Tax=Maribacter cobaltidurans TaxID=1178778 RepID=A0ABU7IWJ3_9FLAO|nr:MULTISPECIES: aminopeptidase P family protein [Maribacter]MDC6389937.1 aminopeptidase P N-terminal domain-containing protein [Maribacter sp. PR1]MEE1977327.1 aminopeptidase P N-terminal domain-containing protein [Maribacter cobaltidurans]
MKAPLLLIAYLFSLITAGQDIPQDYLTSDFHKERREKVRELMSPNSVLVFFSNAERNRANDVDYVYHQDPNFYYLTGYKEPNAVLLIFSDSQINDKGNKFDELIYVQKRNAREEQWTGKRLGVEGVKNNLGFDMVFNGEDFVNLPIDLSSFELVSFFDFENDYRDNRGDADLFDLIKTFKMKANYPSDYDPIRQRLYSMINAAKPDNTAEVAKMVSRYLERYENLQRDEFLVDFVNAPDDSDRLEVKEKVNLALSSNNLDSSMIAEIMSTMRETKTSEEMKLLKKAIEISSVGQIEVMKAMHPNMSETEIQGVHEYVYKKYGAEYEGYPSIVGGGNNGCILHYIENSKPEVGNDLVLMDLGAEYHGYTADVTRTIPANGKFTPEQKAIYDIVYEAQEAGIKASVVGAPFQAPGKAALKVVEDGLMKLGIITESSEARTYFPHGTSHYLGLDVHDQGTYRPFQHNTVITVEPGIYIPEGSDCDKKWWGIAVRIEDDILITENGPENLSAMAPRTTEAIEAMMKQPSPLDDFKLPKLD